MDILVVAMAYLLFPARVHIAFPPSIISRWAIAQHLSFGIGTPVPRAKKNNRAMMV